MTPTSSIGPVTARKATQATVRHLAQEAGFHEAGAVGLPQPEAERDAARFREFVEQGRAGAMGYLGRRNEAGELVRARVAVPFPWARSAVVCSLSYHAEAPLSTGSVAPGAGWIARYAWSGRKDAGGARRPSDYHKVLLKALGRLEAAMGREYGPFESRAYVDTGPVVERSLARAAGLGWTGKNTCLIHPRLGSWTFLAVLLTSLELAPEEAALTVPDRCGSCRRCLDACPTEALIAPYQMDASRCIAYWTIEHRGEISEATMAGMGRQVFGCDICQDVCPWNRKAPVGRSHEDLEARSELVNPDLGWLGDLDEGDFERLFNGSPVRRTGFLGMRRNVAIAMGNSGLRRFLPWVERWGSLTEEAETGSRSMGLQALRGAARWARERIERGGAPAIAEGPEGKEFKRSA